jgi:hypothetical protein
MRAIAVGTAALVLSAATPAFAHRTDEYLQATTVAVEKDHVALQLRLQPGIEVFPTVLALIDTNRDSTVTAAELGAYAERVASELSLSVDGARLSLRPVTWRMEALEALKDGRGTIELSFDAAVPRAGGDRKLVFENHHQRAIAEYLVNALVPRDSAIRLGAQQRSYDQSIYRLDYAQSGVAADPPAMSRPAGIFGWLAAGALLLIARLATARQRAGAAIR